MKSYTGRSEMVGYEDRIASGPILARWRCAECRYVETRTYDSLEDYVRDEEWSCPRHGSMAEEVCRTA